MTALSELPEIVDAAAAQARKMLSAVDAAPPEARVSMEAGQFRKLALLLSTLADAARPDPEAFDAPIDGVRFWVPLPQVQAERAQLAALRASMGGAARTASDQRFTF